MRLIINSIEYLLFYLIKSFFYKYTSANNNKSLLFINSGQIGDLVISSMILENDHSLNNYFNIFFLIKDEYIPLFSDYKGRVRIVGYNYKKYKYSIIYKIKLLKTLQKENFGKCFNLSAARGILNDEMALLSGAKEIYCLNSGWRYLKKFFGKKMDSLYTGIIGNDQVNEYDKHKVVISFLRKEKVKKINIFNENVFNETPLESISNEVMKFDKNYITIAPFTSIGLRNWNFKELINVLSNDHNIFLLGSEDQRSEINKLITNKNVVNLAGTIKLNEIASILSSSKLFIGLDSGVTHIAVKIIVPTVAIIGGGMYGRFFPYDGFENVYYLFHKLDCFGCEWRCKYDKPYCITNIQLDEVLEAVNSLLSRESAI